MSEILTFNDDVVEETRLREKHKRHFTEFSLKKTELTNYRLWQKQNGCFAFDTSLFQGNTTWYRPGKDLLRSGSGCGSVGRAVAPETRGLRFESSHRRQKCSKEKVLLLTAEKKKTIKTVAGDSHFNKDDDLLSVQNPCLRCTSVKTINSS